MPLVAHIIHQLSILFLCVCRWDRKEYLLNRRIQQVREDMWRSEMLAHQSSEEDDDDDNEGVESITELLSHRPSRVTTPVCLPKKHRVKSAPNFYHDINSNDRTRIASGTIRWRKKSAKKEPECRFGSGHVCASFPCKLPASYTNIGFDIKDEESKPAKTFIVATYTSKEDRERLLMDVEANSVRRPLRTSRDQTVQKERSLKKIIAEMKVRSEREQPQDWCINYGKPTSKRKLNWAARPPSSLDFPTV